MPSIRPSERKASPKPWKAGGATRIGSPARSGMLEKIVATGPSAALSSGLRGADLGTPVVPEVRITKRLRSAGRASFRTGPAASSSRLGSVGLAVVPGGDPRPAEPRPVEERLELLVVDDRGGALALQHLGELRSGEVGAEQE